MSNMAYLLTLSIGLLIFATSRGNAYEFDDIEYGVSRGHVMKMIREMVNQTAADTLNLPANATSIRENITDNFSCEDRTYGYYADVDNECQVFHVCFPTQSTSGRNVTYRWSFICPKETVFNQDVLTCTRSRDSIDCEDSPLYYDRNEDLYKTNDTDTQTNSDMHNTQANSNTQYTQSNSNSQNTQASGNTHAMKKNQLNKNKRKGSGNRKQKIVMEMQESMQDTERKANEGQMNEKLKKPAVEQLKVKRKLMVDDMKEEMGSEMKGKPNKPTTVQTKTQPKLELIMETKEPMNMKDMEKKETMTVNEKVETSVLEEVLNDFVLKDPDYGLGDEDKEMGSFRVLGERSLKEKKRNKKRGIFRFKADV